jgi:hypothetical protein
MKVQIKRWMPEGYLEGSPEAWVWAETMEGSIVLFCPTPAGDYLKALRPGGALEVEVNERYAPEENWWTCFNWKRRPFEFILCPDRPSATDLVAVYGPQPD